jgi:general L-amino acid transport system permease protein
MASLDPTLRPKSTDAVPFWRDVRILGILAQIAFIVLVVVVAGWFLGNLQDNLINQLGSAQFRCRDGSTSYRCAFDFLSDDAQFPISESPVEYDPSNSYWRALEAGLANTIKVSVIGIILATILGTLTGIARLSPNWLLRSIAGVYIDIMRNTPLAVQLFFLYFAVFLTLPDIRNSIQLFGLPIYLNQRGVELPRLVFTTSFTTWLAFLILGLIQAQVIWIFLGRREEKTGRESNRLLWSTLSLLLVALIGWQVASNYSTNQSILVARAMRVREFADLQSFVADRLGIEELGDLERLVADGTITEEQLEEAALKVCVLENSASETNLASQLRQANIPYDIERSDRPDQAIEKYAAEECELLAATTSVVAAERDVLENPASHFIVPIEETPVRISIPRIEGLNFVGSSKLTPAFAAALVGLVLYTGAFIAEIVRAGILAVPKGQSEAARALGLTESQRLRLVVLPQALRVIIPPLTSQYLNLTKNSTLAIAVAFPELWFVSFVTINQAGRPIQIMLLVMGTFLILSLLISALLNWYNERVALVER